MSRFDYPSLLRRAKLIEMLSRHSRRVFYGKIVLVLLVLLIFGAMLLLPMAQQEQAGIRIAFDGTKEGGQDGQPVMLNPKFQGVDQKNEPYTVTASRAIQKDTNTIQMEKISADLTTKDQAWLSLTANQGLLQLDKQNLMLSGQVHMFHDAGYEMKTEEMLVDTKTGDASGQKPIDGQGKAGIFHAEGFSIYDKGDRMVFNGRVTMTLSTHAT